AQRVMMSVSAFISRKLKLKVNDAKSAVGRPAARKFLGFTFWIHKGRVERAIAPRALKRFRTRIKELTRRTRGGRIEQIVAELTVYLRGWKGYFGFCQTPSELRHLDSWIRRRLRSLIWKRWKRGTVRFSQLVQRGVTRVNAANMASSAHGPWHLSRTPTLSQALPIAYFTSLGLLSLASRRSFNQPNRRVRTRTHGGVAGKAGNRLPMPIRRRRAAARLPHSRSALTR